jgi:hypothetical protein
MNSNSMKKNLVAVVFLPIFIPTIGSAFIGGIEELPWFLILLPFFSRFKKRLLFIFLTISVLAVFQALLLENKSLILSSALKTLNFMAPIIIIWSRNLICYLSTAASYALYLSLPIALLQYGGFYESFNWLHEMVFQRSTVSLDGSYRGVSAFWNEPARAGYYTAMAVIIRNIDQFNLSEKRVNYVVLKEFLAVAIIMSFLFASITTFIYAVVLVVLAAVSSWQKIIPILVVALGFTITLLYISNFESVFTNQKVDMLAQGAGSGFTEFYNMLTLVSGGRAFALEAMIIDIFRNPFGSLFAGDLFLRDSSYSEVVVSGFRESYRYIPTSSIVIFVYIFGIQALIAIIFLCFPLIFTFRGLLLFISSILYSPASSPFILMFFTIHKTLEKKIDAKY